MKTLLILLALILCIAPASAQTYYLLQTVTGTGGGGYATSSGYSLNNTVGQPATGSPSSSGYAEGQGFWPEGTGLQTHFSTTYSFSDGWNLISLGSLESNYQTTSLFPTARSTAFAYNRGYVIKDTLVPGTGYWLKFSGTQNISVPGVAISNDTVAVVAGWNMVGALGSPVSTNSVTQIPADNVTTAFFGFDGGYQPTDSLRPSLGFWVKCTAPGQLVLSAGGVASPIASRRKSDLAPDLNVLTVSPRTNSGSHPAQTLYFGRALPAGKTADWYEMPPPAPAGMDVRFATNRYAEFFTSNTNAPQEIPLSINNAASAVTISWTMNEHSGQSYILVEKQGGNIVAEHGLAGSGSVTVSNIGKKTLTLKLAAKPVAYALAQNFPNPFNPSTTIQFSLPSAAHVSLRVYNTLGQEVATLINADRQAGYQTVVWNASNYASGVYFYRINAHQTAGGQAGSYTDVKKMVLVK